MARRRPPPDRHAHKQLNTDSRACRGRRLWHGRRFAIGSFADVKSTRIPIDIGRSRPYMLEITAQDVPLCGLPEALCGATLVHMSDLHAGFSNLEPVYEEAIARVNALQPDFIVLTGDYIDDHSREPNYPMPGILR